MVPALRFTCCLSLPLHRGIHLPWCLSAAWRQAGFGTIAESPFCQFPKRTASTQVPMACRTSLEGSILSLASSLPTPPANPPLSMFMQPYRGRQGSHAGFWNGCQLQVPNRPGWVILGVSSPSSVASARLHAAVSPVRSSRFAVDGSPVPEGAPSLPFCSPPFPQQQVWTMQR